MLDSFDKCARKSNKYWGSKAACAASGCVCFTVVCSSSCRVFTTAACAVPGVLFYSSLCCVLKYLFLFYSSLCCPWTCFFYSSQCYPRTCLFSASHGHVCSTTVCVVPWRVCSTAVCAALGRVYSKPACASHEHVCSASLCAALGCVLSYGHVHSSVLPLDGRSWNNSKLGKGNTWKTLGRKEVQQQIHKDPRRTQGWYSWPGRGSSLTSRKRARKKYIDFCITVYCIFLHTIKSSNFVIHFNKTFFAKLSLGYFIIFSLPKSVQKVPCHLSNPF